MQEGLALIHHSLHASKKYFWNITEYNATLDKQAWQLEIQHFLEIDVLCTNPFQSIAYNKQTKKTNKKNKTNYKQTIKKKKKNNKRTTQINRKKQKKTNKQSKSKQQKYVRFCNQLDGYLI